MKSTIQNIRRPSQGLSPALVIPKPDHCARAIDLVTPVGCSTVLTDIFEPSKRGKRIKPCHVYLQNCLSVPASLISVCGSNRCKTCPVYNTSSRFTSSFTNKSYPVFSSVSLSCHSFDIIYLITCKECGQQYVGQTTQRLHIRVSGHRNNIKNNRKIIGRHFAQEGHHMSIQVIEKMYRVQGENDSAFTQRILERESYWMRELGTIFPYGLNDHVRGVGCMSGQQNQSRHVGLLLNNHKRSRRSHGHKKKNSLNIHKHVNISHLKNLHNLPDGPHRVRTALFSVPLSLLSSLLQLSQDAYIRQTIPQQLYGFITDTAYCRLYRPVRTGFHEPENRYFFKVHFRDKGIEHIRVSSLFHDKHISNYIPNYFKDTSQPIISYTYSKPIATKIFNHSQSAKEFNPMLQIMNKYNDLCLCDSEEFSGFIYEPCGHIITGNLAIIDNLQLRNLVSKGPKYREPRRISWEADRNILYDALDDYAKRWVKREEAEEDALSDWLEAMKTKIDSRIKNMRFKIKPPPLPVLDRPEVKEYLSFLQKHFVLSPADKAPNNVTFTCKYHYFKTLSEELGLCFSNSNSSSTYEFIDKPIQDIVHDHLRFLTPHKIMPPDLDLPKMYWLPKMHKSPYKQRFIAGSRRCTTKTLSVLLTRALQAVKEFWQKYCASVQRNSDVNAMWILKNSKDLIEHLEDLGPSKYESVSTWDFSTLYTTLPHKDLKLKLGNLIRNTFSRHKFINVNERKAFFSKKEIRGYHTWSGSQFVELLCFLIDNIYVQVGDEVFRQVIGIPMGTNCAPLVADLYLFTYEFEFMTSLLKDKKLYIARKFSSTFRYIDDLFSLNNRYFKEYVDKIYPPFLQLKNTTDSTEGCSYLDLFIFKDYNDLVSTRLYDKRDDFNFAIVNYPFLDSNIPISPAYGVYTSRLVAFSRACASLSDFNERHIILVSKLLDQGYMLARLKRTFTKFADKHYNSLSKYNTRIEYLWNPVEKFINSRVVQMTPDNSILECSC